MRRRISNPLTSGIITSSRTTSGISFRTMSMTGLGSSLVTKCRYPASSKCLCTTRMFSASSSTIMILADSFNAPNSPSGGEVSCGDCRRAWRDAASGKATSAVGETAVVCMIRSFARAIRGVAGNMTGKAPQQLLQQETLGRASFGGRFNFLPIPPILTHARGDRCLPSCSSTIAMKPLSEFVRERFAMPCAIRGRLRAAPSTCKLACSSSRK